MKRVINPKKTPTDVVTLEQVSHRKFYGTLLDSEDKGFVCRRDFGTDEPWDVRAAKNFQLGNGWDHLTTDSLDGTILSAITAGFEVFEFDTESELFRWLAE